MVKFGICHTMGSVTPTSTRSGWSLTAKHHTRASLWTTSCYKDQISPALSLVSSQDSGKRKWQWWLTWKQCFTSWRWCTCLVQPHLQAAPVLLRGNVRKTAEMSQTSKQSTKCCTMWTAVLKAWLQCWKETWSWLDLFSWWASGCSGIVEDLPICLSLSCQTEQDSSSLVERHFLDLTSSVLLSSLLEGKDSLVSEDVQYSYGW